MEHIPTDDPDIQKVLKIARALGISIYEAADTCDAFETVFSYEDTRREVFEMIAELDAKAEAKGDYEGPILSYGVEMGLDGIKVTRYTDDIGHNEIVELPPPDRALVAVRIKDGFPTDKWLGPLYVNRPRQSRPEPRELTIRERFPESEWPKAVIYTFYVPYCICIDEWFPFLAENIFDPCSHIEGNGTSAAGTAASRGLSFLARSASPNSGLPASGLSPPA